jgi:hypothetical protein
MAAGRHKDRQLSSSEALRGVVMRSRDSRCPSKALWLCRRFSGAVLALALFPLANKALAVEQYTIADDFDGCEHGKLYEIEGGGILECEEYEYFYDYRPRVLAEGTRVLMIGDEEINATLHNGSVYKTKISGDFEGCEFEKLYSLDSGLIFQCQEFNYSYAFRPDVRIFVIDGRSPTIFIDDEEYRGTLFRRN